MAEEIRNKVLIIDDDESTRELIITTLDNFGFEVSSASNGREGIQIAKKEQPDIILLDMQMPQVSGIQTCRVIKKIPSIKNIPVIFFTSNNSREDVLAASSAGGIDYLVKPVDTEELIRRLIVVTEMKPKIDVSSIVKMKPSGRR